MDTEGYEISKFGYYPARKQFMSELTDQELNALPHKQLYFLFQKARAQASLILNHAGRRCCEICCEYVGQDWEKDVGEPYEVAKAYFERVKKALQSRPFQDFSKSNKTKARKEMLSNLKGNRRRPKPCLIAKK